MEGTWAPCHSSLHRSLCFISFDYLLRKKLWITISKTLIILSQGYFPCNSKTLRIRDHYLSEFNDEKCNMTFSGSKRLQSKYWVDFHQFQNHAQNGAWIWRKLVISLCLWKTYSQRGQRVNAQTWNYNIMWQVLWQRWEPNCGSTGGRLISLGKARKVCSKEWHLNSPSSVSSMLQ